MADETNTPVASAETATQEQAVSVKTYVYYYSNPDGATKGERCHEVFTDTPFDVVPWRMHKEAPAEGMVDPVWDDKLNNGLGAWKENSGDAQGQILAQAQETIKELQDKSDQLDKKSVELDQANAKVDQAIEAVKKAQNVGTQQSGMITKTLGKLMASQENTNKLIMTIQKTMMGLAVPKADQPTAPAAQDKNENGGN
ncbi:MULTISPECIES: hypothetical protein [Lactobacillus]|uniref:Uncharacterized protein n=1 Tax=Lactobacillus xujianguonis TaxID=2495899 RepID=A0A437SSQ8_9LACO|nr:MULTISPECIES: hypothetical protein [Lactobacillus]RVU69986.1 hypothetical protein EJK17_10070 [Lactobacillus xujianguonis]